MSWGAAGFDGGGFVSNGSSGPAISLQRLSEDEQNIYEEFKKINDTVNEFLLPALRAEFITGKKPRQITMVYKKGRSVFYEPSDHIYSTSDIGDTPGADYSNDYIVNNFVCRPFTYGKIWGNWTNGLYSRPYMSLYYFRKDWTSPSGRSYEKGQYWLLYFNATERTDFQQLDSLDYMNDPNNHSAIVSTCIKNIHARLQYLKSKAYHGTSHYDAWLAIEKLTDIVAKLHE